MNFLFKYTLIFLIFIIPSMEMHAQKPGRSAYERKWAFLHPFAAFRVKRTYSRVKNLYDDPLVQKRTDVWSSGGKLDAFRHTFFMACFAQKVKAGKLRKLGKAHEKYNYKQFLKGEQEAGELPDSLAGEMDLRNNELGFILGSSNRRSTAEQIREMCFEAIDAGQAWILKRNAEGKFVDCDGKPVETDKKKWSLNKCMVPSNKTQ